MDTITFNLKSEPKYPNRDLASFLDVRHEWFDARCIVDGPVYCLHRSQIDECLKLFCIDSEAVSAERAFAELCDRHHAIGVLHGRFLGYSLLRPLLAWPEYEEVAQYLKLGWSESDVACVVNLKNPTAKINRRLRAATGRLISSPKFLNAVATIRELWDRLPVEIRPTMPIARSIKISSADAKLRLEPAPALLSEFIAEVDNFCDEWHLLGMATWNLPNVRGPNWVPALAPEDLRERGVLSVETPWHFPVLAEDGLGRLLEEEHRRQAAEHGVDDEQSWETYESLFDIYHWQNVLRARYPKEQWVKAFTTQMNFALSEIVGLGKDRVQLLRKRLRALQSGTLTSLQGKR
jgi:hypothetical protein